MLLAIVGTRYSGKKQVRDYYVNVHGFQHVQIAQDALQSSSLENVSLPDQTTVGGLSTPDVDALPDAAHPTVLKGGTLVFSSASELLAYATKAWQLHFVTTDIRTPKLVKMFVRRPFFMLLSVEAPLTIRFSRSGMESLEDFVQDNDRVMFGVSYSTPSNFKDPSCLSNLRELVTAHIFNSFKTIPELHQHLEELDLLDPERLRPGWDAYFMTLAALASQRSNCMKRRVGAVLVCENRVVSTGYNGTPRGLRNCNEGGCPTCNGVKMVPDMPVECVCLHAEENALLEAGRERVGVNAVLYCNTCPCLRCTIKIIQTGVKSVVYNLTYKVDEMSALLFQEAGVELRRYNPPKELK